MATEPRARYRLPLATSIFLLFALLLGAALGAAVYLTHREGSRLAAEATSAALDRSAQVQRELAQRRLENLQDKVALVGQDPDTVRYVSESQGGGLGLGGDPMVDSNSVGDLLSERREQYGFGLGILLDTEGRVLARTDQSEAFEQSLSGDPFVDPVMESLTPVSGYWRQGQALHQAALLPLEQDQELVGFLLLASPVDDELATRVARASGADIAWLLPTNEGEKPIVVASSLAPEQVEALRDTLLMRPGPYAAALREGRVVETGVLRVGGTEYVARLAPVEAEGGARLGATVQLASADAAAAGYRSILERLALAGAGILLVALPLSFLLAKATLRPLRTMATAAKNAAGGKYDTRIAIRGSDELAALSGAFDQLLSDLREKNDIQGYVSNLSRFLPDPGQEGDVPSFVTQREGEAAAVPATPTVTPSRARRLLLGVEWRQAPSGEDAQAIHAQSAQRAAKLRQVVEGAGGEVLEPGSRRALAGFEGAHALHAALASARTLMREGPAATALVEGDVVHGSVDGAPTLLGAPALAADRLLVEAPTGRTLMPKPLGEQLKRDSGEFAVEVVQGAGSGKSFYAAGEPAYARALEVSGTRIATALREANATVQQPAAAAVPSPPRATRGGELVPGTRFGGRYEILAVLGQGGMGVVYKARDRELDDVVALKMLLPAALVDGEHLERLKSEIKLARRITHPNVLRTFDFGEHDGRPYISMEFVRGMTLRYLLKQAGRIPYSAALRIARQLCAGLAAAHEQGVLHRDIKPENLILEASGNAKLMDFGIARPLRRNAPGQTQQGMFVGTPHYAAPEQLAGEEVDARADVYASGVLLCEMFCGKLPFTGNNTMEIYLAQMQSEPIKPSSYWAEIPPALEAIILRCIARDPADRYASAEALGAALAELRA